MPPRKKARFGSDELNKSSFQLHDIQGDWMSSYGAKVVVDVHNVWINDQLSPSKLSRSRHHIWRWMGWELVSVCPDSKVLTWRKDESTDVFWRPTDRYKADLTVDCGTFEWWNKKVEDNDQLYMKIYKNALNVLKSTFETSERLENDHELCVLRYSHVTSVLGVCTITTEKHETKEEDIFKLILFFTLRPQVRKMGFSEKFVEKMLESFRVIDPKKNIRMLTEVRTGGGDKETIQGAKLLKFWKGQGFVLEPSDGPDTYFNHCVNLEYDANQVEGSIDISSTDEKEKEEKIVKATGNGRAKAKAKAKGRPQVGGRGKRKRDDDDDDE